MKKWAYTASLEKEKSREFVVKHYNGGRVLSLPAENFMLEQRILMDYPYAHIDCFENNPDTYAKGLNQFERLKDKNPNLTYTLGDVYEIADANVYDFIYLDLMNVFSIQLINKLLQFFRKAKGMMFLTIQMRREHIGSKENLSAWGAKDLKDFRDRVFPELITLCTPFNEVLKPYNYKNSSENKMSSPMRIYGFKKLAQ
jgi:hypothetical protein